MVKARGQFHKPSSLILMGVGGSNLEQMISTLGFPIACAIGVATYFVKKDKANREDMNNVIKNIREDAREDRNMYRETISKFDDKLDKFGIAIENSNSRLSNIELDVRSIKEKVGV